RPAAPARGRRGGAAAVPAARPQRLPALRGLAVHPAGARVERADRLSGPAVPGLPAAHRPDGGGARPGGLRGPAGLVSHAPAATGGADRRTGWLLLLTGTVGWYASFRLAVDDRRLLSDPDYRPSCDISPVVSCGDVMSSPQGSLFGFPNMLLGLAGFAAVATL